MHAAYNNSPRNQVIVALISLGHLHARDTLHLLRQWLLWLDFLTVLPEPCQHV